jgi:hypothetical protein
MTYKSNTQPTPRSVSNLVVLLRRNVRLIVINQSFLQHCYRKVWGSELRFGIVAGRDAGAEAYRDVLAAVPKRSSLPQNRLKKLPNQPINHPTDAQTQQSNPPFPHKPQAQHPETYHPPHAGCRVQFDPQHSRQQPAAYDKTANLHHAVDLAR